MIHISQCVEGYPEMLGMDGIDTMYVLNFWFDQAFRRWEKYLYDILGIKKKRATPSTHNEPIR